MVFCHVILTLCLTLTLTLTNPINVYNIHKNEWHNERPCATCRMKFTNLPIVFTRICSPQAKSTSTRIRSHFQSGDLG